MTDPTNVHEPVPQSAKLTAREKKWIIYDVGNSAFAAAVHRRHPHLRQIADAGGRQHRVRLGYAQTIASLVIALLMPLLGSIADVQGMKIKFFLGFFGTGVVTCCAMALPLTWLPFLVVYILATIGLNGSLTFYDSMLIDATCERAHGQGASSHGYGWGYIGSTVPFIFCIALIFGGPSLFDWSTVACTRASFIITAIWWVAFTIPLLTSYRQVHYRATRDQLGSAVRGTFSELAGTFGKIVKNKPLWMFMIAFFFYIDASTPSFHEHVVWARSWASTPRSWSWRCSSRSSWRSLLHHLRQAGRPVRLENHDYRGVVAYMCIVFFAAFFLRAALEFWILAILVGMFQGGIQALSRSYYGKIIPKDHANEYYGFYDIFGKTASIIGTFLVATTTSLTGNASIGVLSIAILLAVALVFLLLQKDPTKGSTEAATVD